MKTTFENLTINAIEKGEKHAPWDARNWNHHVVTVRNNDNGKRTSFEYWASIAHPCIDTAADVLGAFECFIGDATAGFYSFQDFVGEFGYTDPVDAYKTWRACKRAAEKLSRVAETDEDGIYDLYSRLSESI